MTTMMTTDQDDIFIIR